MSKRRSLWIVIAQVIAVGLLLLAPQAAALQQEGLAALAGYSQQNVRYLASSSTTAPLSIDGFSPTSGPVGSLVTITGSDFVAVSNVSFAGVPASFSVPSVTQIVATVPPGAVTGPVSVTATAGIAVSAANFTVAAGDGNWALLTPPGDRFNHSAVWDAANGKMIIFGGPGISGSLSNDLWIYDSVSNAWTQLTPSGPLPAARDYHSAVWDAAGGRMLVFGGFSGVLHNDLWSYSPASNAWTQLTPSSSLPAARNQHSAVWDAARGRMLVFGGFSGGGHVNDLWSYAPGSNAWTQLTPLGPLPPARTGHSAVWDVVGARMLVFGGGNNSGSSAGALNDLWSYAPASNAWTQLTPAGPLPLARIEHSAVWDVANARMLVFGGCCDTFSVLNDSWSYSPANNVWTQLTPSGPLPAARDYHSAVWDAAGGRMLVFGGFNINTGGLYDIWSYIPASNVWTQLAPAGSVPPALSGHSAVWDVAHARMLVFGGFSGSGYVNDLWSYAPGSNAWTKLTPLGPLPPARTGHSAVWDTASGRMLVFGGYYDHGSTQLGDLWSYSLGSNSWIQLTSSGALPTPRAGHSAVWDVANARMLVFGGSAGGGYLNELWSYAPGNNAWTQHTPVGPLPSPRWGHNAIWDASSGRMLVFGGYNTLLSLNDLWSYAPASNAWTQLTPPSPLPPARTDHSAVWDAAGGRMLIFGGYNGNFADLNDLWSYARGSNAWTLLAPAGSLPRVREDHSSIWDAANNRMLVFSGHGGGNEVWQYSAPLIASQQLAFTAQPVRGAHGLALGVQPVGALKDGSGAVVTGDNSTVVTLAIKEGTGAAGAALVCDQTSGGLTRMAVSSGVAAFTGCRIDRPGAGYRLQVTTAEGLFAQTAPFNVTHAGDTDGDCRVSAVDFSTVVTYFGATDSNPAWTDPAKLAYRADLNGDREVSVVDFSIVVTKFGTSAASCAPASNGDPHPAP